jgi:hypothetical protein
MSTYNKFKPIYIGGSTNTISSSVGNVSLRVSGNTFLDGNVNITGVSSDLSTTISTINTNTTSLNTRITTDETNITANTNSIVSFNSRITTDETIISNLQTRTTNLNYNSTNGYTFISGGPFAFFGDVNMNTDTTFQTNLNGISTTTFNYLSGVTSNIQTQFNTLISNLSTTNSTVSSNNTNLQSQITSNTNNITSNTNNITSNTNNITALQNLTSGASSNIQTQITNNKNSADSSINVINTSIDDVYALIQNQNILLSVLGDLVSTTTYTSSIYGMWIMNISAAHSGKFNTAPNIYFQCSFYCYFSPGSTLVSIIFNTHNFTITPSSSGPSINIRQTNQTFGISNYSIYGYLIYN